MASLGGYKGKQVAFPFAGYANVFAYRKDLYEAAGLKPPATMEDLVADALKLTDRSKKIYGFVANGQKGPAVAQDWMQYNRRVRRLDPRQERQARAEFPENVKSLIVYKKLFDKAAPPGAADYDWGGREESFRQGLAADMQTWSIGAARLRQSEAVEDRGQGRDHADAVGQGLPKEYGIGGWALGDQRRHRPQEAGSGLGLHQMADESRRFTRTSTCSGAGSYLRMSETTDPDLLAKYPFLPVIATSFVHGDGDFRPRIPQYPELQDMIGGAINAVLVGQADPKTAMDGIQAKAEALFK